LLSDTQIAEDRRQEEFCMSKPIPKTDFLSGNFAPWPIEGECHDLAVAGEIPRELRGAYYRNGPNPQYAPRGDYHWFDGDGMIHGFFLEDGRCIYRNHWVRHPVAQ
jgi:carotenoid cleavage dioxygenase